VERRRDTCSNEGASSLSEVSGLTTFLRQVARKKKFCCLVEAISCPAAR
jgi:hypothetical protein